MNKMSNDSNNLLYKTKYSYYLKCIQNGGGNDAIYAIGGYDGSNFLDSVLRYDTTTNTWSTVASMPTKRGFHGVV